MNDVKKKILTVGPVCVCQKFVLKLGFWLSELQEKASGEILYNFVPHILSIKS